jgi:hypothetical protein
VFEGDGGGAPFCLLRVLSTLARRAIEQLGHACLQVNHWPSLTIHRGEDGGWMMQNEWVVYEAILEPGGPYSAGVRGKEAWLR